MNPNLHILRENYPYGPHPARGIPTGRAPAGRGETSHKRRGRACRAWRRAIKSPVSVGLGPIGGGCCPGKVPNDSQPDPLGDGARQSGLCMRGGQPIVLLFRFEFLLKAGTRINDACDVHAGRAQRGIACGHCAGYKNLRPDFAMHGDPAGFRCSSFAVASDLGQPALQV